MTARHYHSAAELAAREPAPLSWPAVSIAFLCVFTLIAPAGFITAMNLYLLLLVGLWWVASGLGGAARPCGPVAGGMRSPPAPARAGVRPLLWALLPFALAILAGLLTGLGADRYLYFKDAWYYSNPAAIIAVGFVLGRLLDDPRRGLRAFVIGGGLVAFLHVLIFVANPDLLAFKATEIRTVAGTGYYATGVALLLLVGWWGRWRDGLLLPPAWAATALLLCTASVVLSFSRTMMLMMVVGLLAMAGLLVRREGLRIGALVLAGALALGALNAAVDSSSPDARRSFIGKLARSTEELGVRDYRSRADINDNWRGFETYRAVDSWADGPPWQLVLGRGFGAQVDLGLFQNFTSDPRGAVRFIPVFHNGYVYLLVKTGLVGIALYLLAMGWLYRVGRRSAQAPGRSQMALQGRALQACVAVLLVTTWVISGAFNKFHMFPLLMLAGFLLAACTNDG
jgi:hypothetical protein